MKLKKQIGPAKVSIELDQVSSTVDTERLKSLQENVEEAQKQLDIIRSKLSLFNHYMSNIAYQAHYALKLEGEFEQHWKMVDEDKLDMNRRIPKKKKKEE